MVSKAARQRWWAALRCSEMMVGGVGGRRCRNFFFLLNNFKSLQSPLLRVRESEKKKEKEREL
jgi:hypothetical protein